MEKQFENFKTLSVAVRPFCPSARPPGNVKPCLSVRPSAEDAKFQLARPSVRSQPSESHMSVRPSVQSHQNFICPSVRPFKVIEISHVRPSVRRSWTDGRTDKNNISPAPLPPLTHIKNKFAPIKWFCFWLK